MVLFKKEDLEALVSKGKKWAVAALGVLALSTGPNAASGQEKEYLLLGQSYGQTTKNLDICHSIILNEFFFQNVKDVKSFLGCDSDDSDDSAEMSRYIGLGSPFLGSSQGVSIGYKLPDEQQTKKQSEEGCDETCYCFCYDHQNTGRYFPDIQLDTENLDGLFKEYPDDFFYILGLSPLSKSSMPGSAGRENQDEVSDIALQYALLEKRFGESSEFGISFMLWPDPAEIYQFENHNQEYLGVIPGVQVEFRFKGL